MKDLYMHAFRKLDWSPENANESLQIVYENVIKHAKCNMTWYFTQSRRAAGPATILRFCAVLSISAGAVGPLIANVWSLNLLPFSSPLSATLFGAIAATLVGIDRALNLSTRRARYISSALVIEELIAGFNSKWNTGMAEIAGSTMAPEHIRTFLQSAVAFEESVRNIIRKERTDSLSEAAKSLADLEARAEKLVTKPKGEGTG